MLNDVLSQHGCLDFAWATHCRVRWPIGAAQVQVKVKAWYIVRL